MSQSFSRDVLKIVVAQISQTIGWHAIQTTPLELMVDFLHRNLEEICKVTHRYSEQFGQTMPNLDHLGLAFHDLGIDLQDLGEYVRDVESVPCSHDVPQYPLGRDTHLNFLKPGSHEVVHRPVHVHEHLPPMHPDLEDPGKQTPLLTDMPSTPLDGSSSNVFKRPGDPLENPALKRTRLLMEEEGRPLREISSVIMTTSGFLSPAREGKLPESRAPLIPSETGNLSPARSSYPTVPPEVKSEKKLKKSSPSKKTPLGTKKLDKENSKKKELKESGKVDKPKVKKLASMKETTKLKALKSGAKKVPPIASEGNPKDFANFLQNLFQTSNPTKSKSSSSSVDPSWFGPSTSKEASSVEKARESSSVLEGKLSTEPDKQKLNIFKKISKVKEEKIELPPRDSRESSAGLVSEEFTEKSWPTSTITVADSDNNDDEIYISDNLSPPGTPSTPKTPELPSKLEKLGSKKRKKDKSKSKSKLKSLAKKAKLEQIDIDSMERPKTPEAPDISPFTFSSHFPPPPGLITSPIMHSSLFASLPPFPKPSEPSTSMLNPTMPSLPVPPLNFMQTTVEEIATTDDAITVVETETIIVEKEKPVEKEKKSKELKKEKEDKKTKKKKLKKDKIKNKEKGEKKKEKEEKKSRDKEKSKEKKEKKKEREREEKPEILVPKITFKLGPDSSRPETPEGQTRKIVIKPIVKKDEVVPVVEPKRAASPELARISALITHKPKQKSKAVEASCSDVTVPLVVEANLTPKTEPKTKESKKSSFAAAITKDTVAFYHHARAGGPAGPSSPAKPPRGAAGPSRGAKPGDDAGNKIWICPACKGPDDGSPMIGCDDCDAWYHWVCVGIQVPPDDKEDWYCRECIQRKQESVVDKKKKPRKKKDKV